ncbi:hypothetical protein NIES37_10270 [Tolypothrix tenuis PCC 7101]|uniref:Uncharacterized protein n=1 Tax=Tolypothrix tenuis PCC 7101 TaxID=231146 RepID=A0A1Z4MUE2_9CYAN|nr:tetratricopeptide repeat protein [Aulosira sp. FACHB-113]BAY97090.1 hypothetical protein NIES37_10270 [Tolypothrix tenuis PCC 7101]BAZ72402.1 hypothetical protein NIES50_09560 [Aulosira laxa NIES-50]
MSENPAFVRAFNRGVDFLQNGDKAGAILAFSEAISINPDNAYAYYNRGKTKAELQDYDGAIQDLSQTLHLEPKFSNAKYQIGKIYQHIDGQQLSPPGHPVQLDLRKYENGLRKLQFQEYEEAIKEFNQVLHINSNFAPAFYNRGKSFHKLKKNEEAAKDFQIAAKLFCENDQSEKLAVWNPFELGESNREEAITYLIPYLSRKSSYDGKRLAASAMRKLAMRFSNIPDLAIELLLDNLTYPAPQVRQYVLKALAVIKLPSNAIAIIEKIANNDPQEYNRTVANNILQEFRANSNKPLQKQNKDKLDNIEALEQAYLDSEEFDDFWNQESFYKEDYDTSMDYGYLSDLSNPENYLYNY